MLSNLRNIISLAETDVSANFTNVQCKRKGIYLCFHVANIINNKLLTITSSLLVTVKHIRYNMLLLHHPSVQHINIVGKKG